MWLLFIPVVVLVLLFAVASVFAGVFWVIGAGWPWLLIALGVWLFLNEDGRHRRHRDSWMTGPRAMPRPSKAERRHQRAESVSSASQQASPQGSPQGSGPEPRPLRQTELPIDVQVKVEQIRRKVEVLLGYADRFAPFSKDLYLVRQTASEYLPRTVEAYLAMPKQTAEKPLADGKTAHQELKAQLDLLDSKLDDIAQDMERQDTDRLLANRRFLEDRFGQRDVRPAGAEVAS